MDDWTVFGDALPVAQNLNIVCCKPERLARLLIRPEGEYVGVGQSCIEKGMFGNTKIVSDGRRAREMLHKQLMVTASKHTVEELAKGGEREVDVGRIGDEEVLEFGPRAKFLPRRDLCEWGLRGKGKWVYCSFISLRRPRCLFL
jgi:hypothetical protein